MPARKKSARRKRAAKTSDGARVRTILHTLEELYPEADCELRHDNPFQLLIATILSAQCTDKKVNEVTPGLFARYPDAKSLAEAEAATLEEMIRPTGFYRVKARNLITTSRALVSDHGGQVPETMEELVRLPGVARKTGNVVLGTAFGMASGVVVDTHVGRLARKLNLTREREPTKVERDLMRKVPQEQWIALSHRLIWHGRRVCFARSPRCEACALAPVCPSAAPS